MPAFFIAPGTSSGGVFSFGNCQRGQENMAELVGAERFQVLGCEIQVEGAFEMGQSINNLEFAH
jgi:hypothetical protein